MGGGMHRTKGFKSDEVTPRMAVAKPSMGRARPSSLPSNARFVRLAALHDGPSYTKRTKRPQVLYVSHRAPC